MSGPRHQLLFHIKGNIESRPALNRYTPSAACFWRTLTTWRSSLFSFNAQWHVHGNRGRSCYMRPYICSTRKVHEVTLCLLRCSTQCHGAHPWWLSITHQIQRFNGQQESWMTTTCQISYFCTHVCIKCSMPRSIPELIPDCLRTCSVSIYRKSDSFMFEFQSDK